MLTHDIFEWARRTPTKPAIIGADRTWSFAELAEAVARARGGFIARGLFGEGFVSLAIEDQIEVWVLTLALRSLGLTTLTRGFEATDAPMLRCVIKSAKEEMPTIEAACAASGTPLMAVSFENEPPVGLDAGPPIERPGGQVLHTSGTTGVHKKVLIDPSFEDDHNARRRQIMGIREDTVLSSFTCPHWTGAGYGFPAATLACGGAVVIDATSPHASLLEPTLTHAQLTPLILRSILAAPEGAFPRNERLRLLCAGGAVTWPEVVEAKRRITPRISNLLASTEGGTVGLTPIETPEDLRWHRIATEVDIQVVDDRDQPLGVGEVGRIRVRTPSTITGYLNDEKTTAAFFRDGYFYPGDLAFFGEDGRLALQGRLTEVINIDGVKISPAPIEERLRDAIGAQVVLLTMQNDAGEEELHVAIEASTLPPTEALSKALWAEFRNAVRAHVHAVDVFPRNATGKIMRPQLAAQITTALQVTAAAKARTGAL